MRSVKKAIQGLAILCAGLCLLLLFTGYLPFVQLSASSSPYVNPFTPIPNYTPGTIVRELSAENFDFSSAQSIETQEEFDRYARELIGQKAEYMVFSTANEAFCLYGGGADFADTYELRACVPYVWQTQDGRFLVSLELIYYQGENIVKAHESGDLRALTKEETAVYDWALGFVSSIDPDLSDYDKLLLIHDIICDLAQYQSIDISDNRLAPETSPYGLVFEGRANCQGYADTFRLLASLSSVPCQMVSGEAGGGKHIWNKVWLEDGAVAYIDPTFNDSFFGSESAHSYIYFMAPDEIFSLTHTSNEPEPGDPFLFYYERFDLIYYEGTIPSLLPTSVSQPTSFLLDTGLEQAQLLLQENADSVILREIGPYTACLLLPGD